MVGKPPCWHEDRVGDDEYVVVLNRMGHWNDFIAAYALTGDKEYSLQIITELRDWIRNCPCPKMEGSWEEICDYLRKPIPWRTLEAGIRMLDYWPNAFTFLITEDGGQIEGCPSYHNVCMRLFSRWALAAAKCGVSVPERALQIVVREKAKRQACRRQDVFRGYL